MMIIIVIMIAKVIMIFVNGDYSDHILDKKK